MIYIGFSKRSHKLFARIFCKEYKHCAPILVTRNKCVIYQFTKYKKITAVQIQPKDIETLKHFGWLFIKYNGKITKIHLLKTKCFTCVQFTKIALNIKKFTIQTPDALLKYLTKNKRPVLAV